MAEHGISQAEKRQRGRHVWMLLAAVVVAGILVVAALVMLSLTGRAPAYGGIQKGRLAECPGTPNCVSTQSDDTSHWMEPLTFVGESSDVIPRLKRVLARMPRCVVTEETSVYLRAEVSSQVFRFVDDVEFLVEPESQRVHFRSASRAGRSDLGVNRARMEQVRRLFENP